MKVELITYTPDPEKVIACAAKLCYSNSKATDLIKSITTDETSSFLQKLIKMGHMSPLEHASFTFAIEDVSRSLLAQITRHRIASFSVQSQRYVDMNDKFDPIIPKDLDDDDEFNDVMEIIHTAYYKFSLKLTRKYFMEKYGEIAQMEKMRVPFDYFSSTKLIDRLLNDLHINDDEKKKEMKKEILNMKKKAIENARAVLPNACPTQMIVTMNARQLLHFFNERCCNRAQEEIRELAWRMLVLVKDVAPILFANAGPTCLCGVCKEGPMSCGNQYKYSTIGANVYKINYSNFSLSKDPDIVRIGEPNQICIVGEMPDES